jgi:hypothetical protein
METELTALIQAWKIKEQEVIQLRGELHGLVNRILELLDLFDTGLEGVQEGLDLLEEGMLALDQFIPTS